MALPRPRTIFPSSDNFARPLRGRLESESEREAINPKRRRVDDDPLNRSLDDVQDREIALSNPTEVGPSILNPLQGEPWGKYVKLLEEDHAGLVIMAWTDEGSVVAIKAVKLAEATAPKISSLQHSNIVAVREAFMDGRTLYLINEYMAVSLADVAVSPWRLGEREVATVCEGIIRGLIFIHSHLDTNYGAFTCEDVLLANSGQVKLANFGELFLRGKGVDNDAKFVGVVVVELLEPEACVDDAESAELLKFGTPAARSFVRHTKTSDVGSLLREDFISLSVGPHILFKYVEFTRKTVSRSWGLSPDAP